jgi:hypothetical protein
MHVNGMLHSPGIVRPSTSHANAGLWADLGVGWVEEMDEGCCDDDAGTEVAWEGRQCDILWH